MTEPTFEIAWPDPVQPPEPEHLSAGQRLTLRQRAMVERGLNPLRGTVHQFAVPELCTPDAPKGQPFTCGSCRFREVLRHHDRSYPKCLADWHEHGVSGPKVTGGPATDVRAWWPACSRYQAGDPSLSPDAARSIPEPTS